MGNRRRPRRAGPGLAGRYRRRLPSDLSDKDVAEARRRVDHVIVLMLENRSFDHLFAYLPHPGLEALDPEAHRNPLNPLEPELGDEPPSPSGRHILAKDPPHSYAAAKRHMGEVTSRSGGDATYAMNGFVDAYRLKLLNREHLPFIHWRRVKVAAIAACPLIAVAIGDLIARLGEGPWGFWPWALPPMVILAALVWKRPVHQPAGISRRRMVAKILAGGLLAGLVAEGAWRAVRAPGWDLVLWLVLAAAGVLVAVRRAEATDKKRRTPLTGPAAARATERARSIMRCMPPEQVKVLRSLAMEYALCTRWYSSVPGATWPNRNFLHAGTSAQAVDIEVGLYGDRTLFEVLEDQLSLQRSGAKTGAANGTPSVTNSPWCIYYDGLPQVVVFENLLTDERAGQWKSMDDFYKDVDNEQLATYSFIEPRHNGSRSNSYHPGNSQRPTQESSDFARGEELVARIYTKLAQHPRLFERTMLVITFDEHGGLFDRASPPTAPAPERAHRVRHPQSATRRAFAWFVEHKNAPFDFRRYGLRVPTIVISPWIKAGVVDDHVYDHTSILATVCDLFAPDQPPLGNRARQARPFWDLLLSLPAPRTQLPVVPPPRYPPEVEVEGPPAPTAVPPASRLPATTGDDLQMQLETVAAKANEFLTRRGAPDISEPQVAAGQQDPEAEQVAARLHAWSPPDTSA